jgi:tRNA (cytidine56-2'-O)-methyltransferase
LKGRESLKSPKWRIIVLKLDHRPERDKRVTTHIGLTARAFGASGLWTAGLKDPKIVDSIKQVTSQWGFQGFQVITGVKWRNSIGKWKEEGGEVIHLTMYGLHIDKIMPQINSSPRPKLIVVGSSKVPIKVYNAADYNVAIGHQPHSEIAALAIFLDRLFEGKVLHKIFPDAKMEIEPTAYGKRVKETK